MPGSKVAGLKIIPIGNDASGVSTSSWSNCCCWRSHADITSGWGTSARCGCRWPTGASQGRREVSSSDGLLAAALAPA